MDLEDIVSRLPLAVYVCEAPSGVLRFYNRRAAELWGREPKLGDANDRYCGALRRFAPGGGEIARSETAMARVLQGGETESAEDRFVIERSDGSRLPVRVVVKPLHDEKGRLSEAMATMEPVAAEEPREDEARYRAIVENQPEMVCRFLADGTMTFANESYCRYFGVDRDEVIGKPYVPIVHPDDLPHVSERVASLSPDNRVVTIDNRVIRPDGSVRWTQWTNRALYDSENRLEEYQSTGRDITEQRRAEEAAARLAAIVEGAEDAIVSKGLDGVITSWNRAAEILFGFSADEAVGRSVTLIIPPERLDEERRILNRLARGEMIESFETVRLRKDGKRIRVSLTISPIRDASGRVVGASKIARDIGERLRSEADLKKTVQTLESLYRLVDGVARSEGREELSERALDAITSVAMADRASVLVFDESGVMRFTASRGLSERYRAAVDGHSPWSRDAKDPAPILVEDVLDDPAAEAFRETFSAEGIRALGFIPLVYAGRLLGKFMLYYDQPHRFTAEELRLAATIGQHVSFGLARLESDAAIESLLERERAATQKADAARRAAERANAAKDEFLAMLAHELRNPLSVIANAISVIETTGGLHPRSERAGQMIGRQTAHLARLLDDLLDVARITSGRFELNRELIDLREIVTSAAEAQSHRIGEKDQCLSLELPDDAVTVSGDPIRLQQVVGNLVNNASKYTPAGGAIRVTIEGQAREAVLRVRDDGVGIAPDALESIFEPFTQVKTSLARTEGGLGLGLTLVKRVVELHRGEVRASSVGPGRGTELTVRLPLSAVDRTAADAAPAPAPFASRRVLIIEDNADGRETLVTLLQLQGHDVEGVATGKEGIEAASRHAPEIVLVDIGLPDIDGYQVGKELRRRLGQNVRLIALTGYSQPKDRARSKEAGFDAHLVKPIAPSVLASAFERETRTARA